MCLFVCTTGWECGAWDSNAQVCDERQPSQCQCWYCIPLTQSAKFFVGRYVTVPNSPLLSYICVFSCLAIPLKDTGLYQSRCLNGQCLCVETWFVQLQMHVIRWGLCALRHGIQISMEAILACHPARSTEWLDCHPKSCDSTMRYSHRPHCSHSGGTLQTSYKMFLAKKRSSEKFDTSLKIAFWRETFCKKSKAFHHCVSSSECWALFRVENLHLSRPHCSVGNLAYQRQYMNSAIISLRGWMLKRLHNILMSVFLIWLCFLISDVFNRVLLQFADFASNLLLLIHPVHERVWLIWCLCCQVGKVQLHRPAAGLSGSVSKKAFPPGWSHAHIFISIWMTNCWFCSGVTKAPVLGYIFGVR